MESTAGTAVAHNLFRGFVCHGRAGRASFSSCGVLAMSSVKLPVRLSLAIIFLLALSDGQSQSGDRDTPTWDAKAAAAYLDNRAEWWLGWSGAARGQGTACLSCHTAVPFALARPTLNEARSGSNTRMLEGVKKRVENWAKIVAAPTGEAQPFVPYYSNAKKPSALGTEAVLNALILVTADRRQRSGPLSDATRNALDHLWEQQQPSGAWRWLDFGLNPWEKDGAYYGAALAGVAVGTAGPDYYDRGDVRPKVAALVKYLRTRTADQPLHHRVVGLWAAGMLPGVLTDAESARLIAELFALQRPDGGWSLPPLGRTGRGGEWQAKLVYPDGAVSDGYATGLIVLALKRAGVPAEQPNLRRAVAWLASQQADGTWPATYPNSRRDPGTDIGRFMRDAATGYAIIALTDKCRPSARKPAPSK